MREKHRTAARPVTDGLDASLAGPDMATAGHPLTVADVLTLPVLSAGQPQVVTGADLLDRPSIVERFSRSPHQVPPGEDLPGEFLRLACLTYGDDYPGRTGEADQLLTRHPELATADVFTMAATGSDEPPAAALAASPGLARSQGGAFGWEPLLYLTNARLAAPSDSVASARLLLHHGADPNAGFLWDRLPSPFTALTGAFGGGEGHQARHPRGMELARLLLEAGADPNDGQSLYNLGATSGNVCPVRYRHLGAMSPVDMSAVRGHGQCGATRPRAVVPSRGSDQRARTNHVKP